MKIKSSAVLMGCLTLCLFALNAKSQTKPVLFEGTFVAGYVDKGAYLNFVGPAVKFSKKPYAVLLGLLPGIRIKEDKVGIGAPKNSLLTPSLGFGVTAAFHHFAIQIPLYYNAKTSSKNGEWHLGGGLGYKF